MTVLISAQSAAHKISRNSSCDEGHRNMSGDSLEFINGFVRLFDPPLGFLMDSSGSCAVHQPSLEERFATYLK